LKQKVMAMALVLIVGLAGAANGEAMLINVNLDWEERTESTLDGPLDGDGGSDMGVTWNQIIRQRRGWDIDDTDMIDSTGAATTVKFRVDRDGHELGCWLGAPPSLCSSLVP